MLTLFRKKGPRSLMTKAAKIAAGTIAAATTASGSGGNTLADGQRLLRAVARQKKMIDRAMKKTRKRKRSGTKKRKRKANKKIKSIVNKELEKGRSIGKYRKVLKNYLYRQTQGLNVDNGQGVHEFYSFEPKELLDAVSVMFNGKTPAVDYTVATNNFSGDPDFTISGSCKFTLQNISQVDQELIIIKDTMPKQDSDTKFTTRWQASLDEVASSVTFRQWDVKTSDGSKELSRYWSGTSKGERVVIRPGESYFIGTHVLPKTGVNWEDMKYQGSVITYKKGVTKGLVIIQQNPILRNHSDGKIGIPTDYLGGMVLKKEYFFRALCPDQATEASNVDKMVYFNNFDASVGYANVKMPSKPGVVNIADFQQ